MQSQFQRRSSMSRNAQVGVKKLSKKQYTKLANNDPKNRYCFLCDIPFSLPPKMLSIKVYAPKLGVASVTSGDLLLCNECARYKSALTQAFIASECVGSSDTPAGGKI